MAGYDVTLVANEPAPSNQSELRIITTKPIASRWLRMTWGPIRAFSLALRLRPHIIHLHDPELIPLGLLASLSRLLIIFDAHEDLEEQLTHKTYLPRVVRRALRPLIRALLFSADRRFDALVAATPHIASRRAPRRAAVVQNFPILSHFATANREDPNELVYIGGISESRGALQMLDATVLLAADHPVTLHLAGGLAPELARELCQHEGYPNVEYHGVLNRTEVAQLLQRCSVGLVLFAPAPNNENGQPTKMFEYMAAGLPVVASDFPLWRAQVQDTGAGLVVDPLSPNAIANALRRLMDDLDLARTMGQRGRQLVERERNWANEEQALLNLYGSIA